MHERARASRPPAGPLLSVREAGERLAVSDRFVWALLSAGRLTPIRFGRRCTRIDPAEVEALINDARQGR